MGRTLRVLILEDSKEATDILLRELRRSGYDVDSERVATVEAMQATLTDKNWDLILGDHNLPGLDAAQVVDVLKAHHSDLPFLIISGTPAGETAVAALKADTNDVVPRGIFSNLGFLIEQELHESRLRQERKQTEKQLQFYASIVESANDAIIGKALDGIILSWNPGAERLYGYKAEEVIGKSLMIIVPSDRSDELGSILERIKKGQRIERYETVRQTKDGRQLDISLNVSPILDDEGQIVGASAIGHDITERKQVEAHAARLKRLYATLSQINQSIVRMKKPEELYQAICDIALQFGGFALAWIGLLDESTGDVRPHVVTGMEIDTDHWPFPLANIHDGPLVNGLVATSIRTARVTTSEDIQTDTRTQQLRAQSRSVGFHSAAAIPFGLRGRIIGSLSLLSHEIDFFKAEEEVNLLKEISVDVSFAVETMETETERTRAQEMLLASEQKFSLLFEKSSYSIALSSLPQGILVDINPAFEKAFGYTKQEAIGKTSLELGLNPDAAGRARMLATLNANGAVRDQEVVLHTKSGEARIFSVNVDFVEIGNQKYILNTTLDITERKRILAELQQSEARFSSAFYSSPTPIIITRVQDRKIVDVNEAWCQTLGYTREQAVGRTSIELGITDAETRQRITDTFKAKGMLRNIEASLSTRTGEKRDMLVSMETLDFNGELHSLTTLIDITDRKQAEEALQRTAQDLRRSNTELEQFAYVSSHDLQEPLRMVSSYVQLLAKRYKGKLDSDADDFIGFAVEGATRMQQLINDLLAYSRVGTQSKPFASTDLEAVLDNALANLQIALEESQASITHDPLPTLMADQVQMVQLFQNLIGNAIKFRGKTRPQVHIHAERDPQGWSFAVSDNGIGIDPQFSERIFIIFQRLHTRAEYGGTGIGLAICKKILERHGGQIWFEPAPEQGSIFHFTIPDQGVPHDN